jgi:calcium-dependent protein kinase
MKAKYSPICDIFSLGLIFHLLLFGKSLFKGKTYNEILSENRSCSFDLNSAEYEKVDELAMDLLKKMLKINPEERITAEQALSHPFFKCEEEKMVEEAKEEEEIE